MAEHLCLLEYHDVTLMMEMRHTLMKRKRPWTFCKLLKSMWNMSHTYILCLLHNLKKSVWNLFFHSRNLINFNSTWIWTNVVFKLKWFRINSTNNMIICIIIIKENKHRTKLSILLNVYNLEGSLISELFLFKSYCWSYCKDAHQVDSQSRKKSIPLPRSEKLLFHPVSHFNSSSSCEKYGTDCLLCP